MSRLYPSLSVFIRLYPSCGKPENQVIIRMVRRSRFPSLSQTSVSVKATASASKQKEKLWFEVSSFYGRLFAATGDFLVLGVETLAWWKPGIRSAEVLKVVNLGFSWYSEPMDKPKLTQARSLTNLPHRSARVGDRPENFSQRPN
jgi:hypothetical protein